MSTYDDNDIINIITHYQKSIERHTKSRNDQKVLHSLSKLRKLPIKVRHLEQTGIGRTVNALRKEKHEVGDAARALVAKWKNMVVEEDSQPSGSEESNEDSGNEMQEDDSQISNENHKSSSKSYSSKADSVDNSSGVTNTKYAEEDLENKNEHKEHKSVKRKHDETEDDSKSKHKKSKKSHHNEEKSQHSKHSSSKSSKRSDENEKEKHSSSSNKSSSKEKDGKHKHDNSSSKSTTTKERDHSHSEKSKQRSSSSSSSHKDRKNEKKACEEISSDNKKTKNGNHSKNKKKVEPNKYRDGIDSGSGASFAEALGMLEPCSSKTVIKYKKTSPAKEEIIKPPTKLERNNNNKSPVSRNVPIQAPDLNEMSLPQPSKQLEPVDVNLSSLLPQITPNYRPVHVPIDSHNTKQKQVSEYDALKYVISSKNQRTKVYSGNKIYQDEVPTLFEICTRILQDNIDALEYTGGVPYIILKPILEKATPDQLFVMEHHNPYLIEDSDELWELHCKKQFRTKQREEMESWREMYMRCLDEREAKLKTLTANIKQSQDKSLPVRQTKLAYVDSIVKPPRNVQKKQMKNGILEVKRPSVTPQSRLAALATAGSAGQIAVPNPGQRAVSSGGGGGGNSSAIMKPKKAPLMQKALALIKSRFRR